VIRKAIGRAAADLEGYGEEARYLSDASAIERLAYIDSTDALKAFLATRLPGSP
jgi:hypothetical protein